MNNIDIKELEHFDELEFFVKKYNSLHYVFELAQDVFNKKELERFNNCSTYLKYAVFKNQNNLEKKLIQANFCKNRWCGVCNWRRALKYQNILNERIDFIKAKHKSIKFIFITFTIKNTYYKNLKKDLNLLLGAFRRLFRDFARVAKNPGLKGYVRSLEFTLQKNNIEYVNLHIHCLVAVSKKYFEKKYDYFISQEEWTELWKKALKVDYTPIVYVESIKRRGKNKKLTKEQMAVKEVVKYVLKGVDILRLQREKRSDIFKELYINMKNVRNLGFGGIFAPKNFKNIENKENEDLVKVGNSEVVGELLGEMAYVLKEGKYVLHNLELF